MTTTMNACYITCYRSCELPKGELQLAEEISPARGLVQEATDNTVLIPNTGRLVKGTS